jgi:hypothetical protein
LFSLFFVVAERAVTRFFLDKRQVASNRCLSFAFIESRGYCSLFCISASNSQLVSSRCRRVRRRREKRCRKVACCEQKAVLGGTTSRLPPPPAVSRRSETSKRRKGRSRPVRLGEIRRFHTFPSLALLNSLCLLQTTFQQYLCYFSTSLRPSFALPNPPTPIPFPPSSSSIRLNIASPTTRFPWKWSQSVSVAGGERLSASLYRESR